MTEIIEVAVVKCDDYRPFRKIGLVVGISQFVETHWPRVCPQNLKVLGEDLRSYAQQLRVRGQFAHTVVNENECAVYEPSPHPTSCPLQCSEPSESHNIIPDLTA
jgi:hypothetical protein